MRLATNAKRIFISSLITTSATRHMRSKKLIAPLSDLCRIVIADRQRALAPWMLPNHEYPIPQREPLIRIIRNRRIQRREIARDVV